MTPPIAPEPPATDPTPSVETKSDPVVGAGERASSPEPDAPTQLEVPVAPTASVNPGQDPASAVQDQPAPAPARPTVQAVEDGGNQLSFHLPSPIAGVFAWPLAMLETLVEAVQSTGKGMVVPFALAGAAAWWLGRSEWWAGNDPHDPEAD